MHICFLSSLHPPLDKRVHYKEAVTLARAGFRVTHIAPGDPGMTSVDGVRVLCFPGRTSVGGRIRQMWELYRLARRVRADVYHCNEIESWTVGVLLKIRYRVRIVFDVHEVYSTNVSERLFPKRFRPAVEASVRMYFRLLLPFTDRLVFAKRTVRKDFPARPGKTVLVQNFVEIPPSGQLPRNATIQTRNAPGDSTRRIVALHLGAINVARGWPQLLQAATMLKSPELLLSIVGRFGDGTESRFLEEVNRLGLEDRVSFTPWIPYDEVPRYAASCHIGLITFQPVHDNFINALPHKLFDYMLAGLPVIVPDFAVEVAEIVRESRCGLLVDTTKPEEIAAAMDRLAGDDALRREMAERGRQAVLLRYNWQREGETLVSMYRALGETLRRRSVLA